MEGMAVGGKSCCPITVRGERHGSLAGRSGVRNLSSHNYYCTQLFISWVYYPRAWRVVLASTQPLSDRVNTRPTPFHPEIL